MERVPYHHQRGTVQKHEGYVRPREFITPSIHPSPNHHQYKVRTEPIVMLDLEIEEFSLYKHYLSKEKAGFVIPTYLTTIQKVVDFKSRHKAAEIMFWLHKSIQHRFDKTFLLAMRMFDRCLSVRNVPSLRDLYKLCITCVFTAGKFEECYLAFGISDIFHLCQKDLGITVFGYNVDDFLKAEVSILKTLNHRLSVPTLHDFVSIMSENIDFEQRKVVSFLMVSASAEYCLHRFDLSILSLGIVLLSEIIWNNWAWESFDHYEVCQRIWNKPKEEVQKSARILWSLILKRHFDIIIKVYEKQNCIKDSKNISVTDVVFEWSQKVFLFESQQQFKAALNNNTEPMEENNINLNNQ